MIMKYQDSFSEKQTLGLHKFEGSNKGRLLSNERVEETQNEDGLLSTLYVYDVEDIEDCSIFDYDYQVQKRIREKYSIDDELAIQRQRDTKVEEFNAYFAYCEKVKKEVKEELANITI